MTNTRRPLLSLLCLAAAVAAMAVVLHADPPTTTNQPVWTTGNQTVAGNKSFTGTITVGGFTLTPPNSSTLLTTDSTATVTNKSLSGAGNTFTNIGWSSLTSVPTTVASLGVTNGAAIDTLGGKTLTGSGNLVLSTSPTLVTPSLGVATVTTLDGITFTSGTNTYTITVGTAAITAPAGLSGTLSTGAFAPNMPAFLVNTATGTTLVSGTPGQIIWDTVIVDSAGGFATSSYTCPRAGLIELGFAVYTGGEQWIFYLNKNGSNVSYMSYGEAAADIRQHGATVIQVAAGDVLELYGLQESGISETNGTGDPTQQGFWGHYIY